MARIARARILRGDQAEAATQLAVSTPQQQVERGSGRARVVGAELASAHEEARAIVVAARDAADRIVADARAEGERSARALLAEAEAEKEARVAAALLNVKVEEERRAVRDLARLLDTAVVLAERLVGAALAVDSERILAMAQAALHEARGARRAVIEANPLDAEALRAQLQELGLPEGAVSVEEHASLARGDLVLKTNLGTVDARLKPQLKRLADALSRTKA